MSSGPKSLLTRTAVALLVGVALAVVVTSCGDGASVDTTTTSVPTSSTIDPATTQEGVLLNKYVTARNAGDVPEAMKAFAGGPVVKSHPFALNDYMDRTSEVRDVEDGVAAIQGSGAGFEFVDIVVADGSSVVAPDVTFNWRFHYGADGSEAGGEAGCIGGRDAKVFISNGQITEINWGFDDPSQCGAG